MNWKQEAVEKLESLDAKKQALGAIPQEMKRLDMEMTALRGAGTDSIHVQGGSKREDKLLSMIVKRQELESQLDRTKLWVELVEQGLCRLEQEERKVLDRFYICPVRGAAEFLANELAVDVKTIYRWKDSAVRKFTLSMYGALEN